MNSYGWAMKNTLLTVTNEFIEHAFRFVMTNCVVGAWKRASQNVSMSMVLCACLQLGTNILLNTAPSNRFLYANAGFANLFFVAS
jgi:hypothetical protein